MNLSSLPPELKLYIIGFLDLVPTLHFALTSKVHLELSRGCLKEHAMFAKYSTIQTTIDGTLMWDLTKEILADPRKGWYVRELNLIAGRREMHEALSEEDKSLFKAAARKILPKLSRDLSFFAAEDSNNLRQLGDMLDHSIGRGFEDAVRVILIYHLPQLRVLRMSDSIGDDCFLVFMRLVAAGYQNPMSAPHMPLQRLKTVQVSHSDTEFCIPVDWAVYFLCIPSLRNFAAFMMGSEGVGEFHADVSSQDDGGGEAHLRNTAGIPVSNVEELMFYNCQFDPQTFNTVLPMVKNLKRFCYHAGGHTVAYADYEPRKVIRTLANHSADSLEELQLTDFGTGEENERDINFVSARGFKKLKALHCEARWLLPEPNYDLGDDEALSQGFHTAEEEPEEIKDPRDNLPDTLEYLYLDGIYNDMEEWYQMTGIFDTPNANTPKLTLDTTCLMSGGETSYGRAVQPEVKFGNHQLEEIRDYLQVYG